MNIDPLKIITFCLISFLLFSCQLLKSSYSIPLKQMELPMNKYNIQTIYHKGDSYNNSNLLKELGIDSGIIFHEQYDFFPNSNIKKNLPHTAKTGNKFEEQKTDSSTFEGIYIFLGKKANGAYILVIDKNNNHQFTDDRIIELPENYTSPLNNNVNYFIIQPTIMQTTNIPNLHPIYGAVNIKMYDKNFYNTMISVGFGMGYEGILKFKQKRWNLLFIRSCCTDSFLNTGFTSIYINNKKTYTNHFIGYTLLLDNRRFLVKSFNENRPEIKLKQLRGKAINKITIQKDSLPQNKIQHDSIFNTIQQVTAINPRGKVIFANYWFANCPPCIAEFPAFNKLYAILQGNTDIQFFSFASESADTVQAFIQRYNIQFPVYAIDSTQTATLLNGVPVYPTNIIYNKQGTQIYLKRGGSILPLYAEKYIMETILPLLLKASKSDSIETKNE